MSDNPQGFEAMKARLDEIVDEVSAEGVTLDEALALYEEAVKLGLAACDVSEAAILVADEAEGEPEGEIAGEGAASEAATPEDAAEASAAEGETGGDDAMRDDEAVVGAPESSFEPPSEPEEIPA